MAAFSAGSLLPVARAAAEPISVAGAMSYARSSNEFAAAIVLDAATGKELYSYQPDAVRSAASLTKLMSSLVVLDTKPRWDRIVALTSADEVGGGRLRVTSGATMSIRDLWYSSIVASANNTVMTLARTSGLSSAKFATAMNKKAKDLGMTQSSFTEPSGMDPKNKVTARDMAILAQAAFNQADIRRAATTASYAFNIRNQKVAKTLTNTNTLLTEDPDVWVTGGKTGFLYESQYNLAVRMRASSNPKDPAVLVIILGSPTKTGSFVSAKALAQWAWKAYRW